MLLLVQLLQLHLPIQTPHTPLVLLYDVLQGADLQLQLSMRLIPGRGRKRGERGEGKKEREESDRGERKGGGRGPRR